jgi:hypothetical protein
MDDVDIAVLGLFTPAAPWCAAYLVGRTLIAGFGPGPPHFHADYMERTTNGLPPRTELFP